MHGTGPVERRECFLEGGLDFADRVDVLTPRASAGSLPLSLKPTGATGIYLTPKV